MKGLKNFDPTAPPVVSAHWWRPSAWLRVAGSDAFSFLQGQFTNDLRTLTERQAVYGLWLDQKGRVQADSFVAKAGQEAFWVGSYFSAAAALRARLEAYIIADDVTVTDETGEWMGLTLMGAEIAAAEFGASLRFEGRRGAPAAMELMFAAGTLPAVQALLDRRPWPRLTAGDMERRRICAGIPAVPGDIGPGDLPGEGGLDAPAISYTKGCYLGQEVMARLKSMGRLRRRLLRVTGAGVPPALPAVLFQGAKKVGELRSVAATEDGFAGLAMFTLLGLDPRAALSLVPAGPPAMRLTAPDDAAGN